MLAKYGTGISVEFFTQEANSAIASEQESVAKRKTDNMAVVLACLGQEGWEIVQIQGRGPIGSGPTGHYAYAGTISIAFLKRLLPPSEGSTTRASSWCADALLSRRYR